MDINEDFCKEALWTIFLLAVMNNQLLNNFYINFYKQINCLELFCRNDRIILNICVTS